MPENYEGTVSHVDGNLFLEPFGDSTGYNQWYRFKESLPTNCYFIEGAHMASDDTCFVETNTAESCQEVEFYSQVDASGGINTIHHNELFFACCDDGGDSIQILLESNTTESGEIIPTEPEENAPEVCDPKYMLETNCAGGFDLFWVKTSSATSWEPDPGDGHCINNNGWSLPFAGYESQTITKVDGDEYLEAYGPSDGDNQWFKFAQDKQCYVIDAAHKAANFCFHTTNVDRYCNSVEFNAQRNELATPPANPAHKIHDISHGELVFGCCA